MLLQNWNKSEFSSLRYFVVDLSNSLLKFPYRLHHQSETFMEIAVTVLHPGRLQLSDPRKDPVQLLLHLPLLLQLSLQGLSGANFCFVGSVEVGQGWLQLQHLLDRGGPQWNHRQIYYFSPVSIYLSYLKYLKHIFGTSVLHCLVLQ